MEKVQSVLDKATNGGGSIQLIRREKFVSLFINFPRIQVKVNFLPNRRLGKHRSLVTTPRVTEGLDGTRWVRL